jgi:hypothetical protein
MDVYLSREALQELEALRILAGRGEGILRGHRRGQRFFVEHILPIPGAVSASKAKLRQIQDFYPEAFLGFFCTDPGAAKKKKVQIPQTVGKVFLEISSRETEKPVWQAHLIDYDGSFRLAPLKILKAS